MLYQYKHCIYNNVFKEKSKLHKDRKRYLGTYFIRDQSYPYVAKRARNKVTMLG